MLCPWGKHSPVPLSTVGTCYMLAVSVWGGMSHGYCFRGALFSQPVPPVCPLSSSVAVLTSLTSARDTVVPGRVPRKHTAFLPWGQLCLAGRVS